MRYFEYNLPKEMPSYIEESHRADFNVMLNNIRYRMDLLEDALCLSGLRGEVFSLILSRIFDPEDEHPFLDSMNASDIAVMATLLAENVSAEPRLEWPNAVTVVDTAFVTRREWEKLRMIGIGGSDAAVVLGLSPYRSAQRLFHDKRGTTFKMKEAPDSGKDFIFAYGHLMEGLVIDQFCKLAGCERLRETRMFCHKDYPYLTANIDAVVRFPNGRLSVFEAKTTTIFNKDAWDNHKCPLHYVPQCRQYMAVLNDPRIKEVYIGCIYGNTSSDFASGAIPRDFDAEQKQINAEMHFWENNVKVGNEPQPSGNSKQDMALLRMKLGMVNPSTKDKVIDLPVELVGTLKTYMDVREQRRQAEAYVDKLKNQEVVYRLPVEEALGQNMKGQIECRDGTVYIVSNGLITRKSTDYDKLALSFPDAYAACVHTTENVEHFTIKEKKPKGR